MEVPQRVQPGVFRLNNWFALLVPLRLPVLVEYRHGYAPGNLGRHQSAADDVFKAHNRPLAARKDEVVLALRTAELPLVQGAQQIQPDRYGGLAGLGLRLADRLIPIGALADVQFAALEVDILPPQPACLAGA